MVNHQILQGRNVRDVELKKVKVGNDEFDFVDFTIVWSDKKKEADEAQDFKRCKAWRHTAAFIDKYFHNKGAEMIVEGKELTEKWTDKDGNKRSQNVLMVDRVHFCGRKQTEDYQSGQTAPEGAKPDGTFVEVESSELPF